LRFGGVELKLSLVAYTKDIERMIAAAILTTCTNRTAAQLYDKLEGEPERVERLVSRIPLTHGSVLEHNRIVWLAEATSQEILELILKYRFFEATQLREGLWLLSANLRTIVEYIENEKHGRLRQQLLDTLKKIAPILWRRLTHGN